MKTQICEICEKKPAETKFRSVKVCYGCEGLCEEVEKEDRGTNLEDYEEYDEEGLIVPKKENPKEKVHLVINDLINFKGEFSNKNKFYVFSTIEYKAMKYSPDFYKDRQFDLNVVSNLFKKYKVPNDYNISQVQKNLRHSTVMMLIVFSYYEEYKKEKNYIVSKALEDVLREVKLEVKNNFLPSEFLGYFQFSDSRYLLIKIKDSQKYNSKQISIIYPFGNTAAISCLEIPNNYDFSIQNFLDEKYSRRMIDEGFVGISRDQYKELVMLALNLVLFSVNNHEFNQEYNKYAPDQIPFDKRNQQFGAYLPPREIIKLDLEKDYQELYNDFVITGKYTRRGHFRWQHYGKRSENKMRLIFIEATMVSKRERLKIANPHSWSDEVKLKMKHILKAFDQKIALFSYGSNNPEQLSQRLGKDLHKYTFAAIMDKSKRFFVGYSTKWQGGVATVIPDKDKSTYGYVTLVDKEDLDALDVYEGVSSGKYKRKKGKVTVLTDYENFECDVIYYVATAKEYSEPSDDYLNACLKTINSFFVDGNGKKFTLKFMKSLLPKEIKKSNPVPAEYHFSNYLRVIPRDLFNEAKLLKCLGKVSVGIFDGKLGNFELTEKLINPEDGFEILQNEDGDIVCDNYKVYKGKEEIYFFSRLNSRLNWPLMTIDNHGEYISVFEEDGSFTNEFKIYLSEI